MGVVYRNLVLGLGDNRYMIVRDVPTIDDELGGLLPSTVERIEKYAAIAKDYIEPNATGAAQYLEVEYDTGFAAVYKKDETHPLTIFNWEAVDVGE